MSRRRFLYVLGAWALVCLVVGLTAHSRASIDEGPMPDEAASRWALAALDRARVGEALGEPPASATEYRAPGPIVVIAWLGGVARGRHVARNSSLADTVWGAAEAFADEPRLTGETGWTTHGDGRVRFTVEVARGVAPVLRGLPIVTAMNLVPVREGLMVTIDGETSLLTAQELLSEGVFDRGVETPLPELVLGAPVEALVDRLLRDLGLDPATHVARAEVHRVRFGTLAESIHPGQDEVTEESLRRAAVAGAEFLLRHQHPNGRYVYEYDARTGRERRARYNMPRHAGTTYFLAQVDNLHGHEGSRQGAIAALRWLKRNELRQCGEHICVESYGRADIGSAALTVVAATEILEKADDPTARELAEGLTAFIRSQQRDDGELMHEFDLEAQEPIDIQHMYYSGEAAFALLKAHAVLGDERDLEAARKLMTHLTGAGWDFLGSRYYYGEEHWTCIAAGEARERIDSPEARDFCRRWYEFNDRLQYRAGETAWKVEGGYGAGSMILPRLTPVGSRTEAFIQTYRLLRHHGAVPPGLRGLIERGLGQLLRWQWTPGPTHLFAKPTEAFGGMPGSPADLLVRNDFVQHAGSAFVEWADVLREE